VARPQQSDVVSTDELAKSVTQGEIEHGAQTLLDARGADRFAGENETIDPVAGHIPGARSAAFSRNLDEQGRFLPTAALRERWDGILGGQPPSKVISMCGSGVTACHNLLALEVAGLPGARLYAGSWSEWIRDASRPVAPRPRK
jgi:thiosulfate/3-mercaptopyruvate sulfurtransferase